MAEREKLIRLAVFGKPISQSLSPLIHPQFAAQFGLEIDYQAIECPAGNFSSAARLLANSGAAGCNITAPLKHEAWACTRSRSPAAGRAEAANTLVFNSPDDWYADNTDGRGLVRDLDRCLGEPLHAKRILILGAGGAASGILGDLLEQQPAELVLSNRTLQKCQDLASRFQTLGAVTACATSELPSQGTFDLVINATSLGHKGLVPDLSARQVRAGGWCYDLNYGAAAHPLKDHCEALGIPYQDGLGMLVEQAAVAFTLWTGSEPKTKPVLSRLRQLKA